MDGHSPIEVATVTRQRFLAAGASEDLWRFLTLAMAQLPELERLLEGALGDKETRRRCVSSQARVVQERYTYDSLVERLPRLILDDLRETT